MEWTTTTVPIEQLERQQRLERLVPASDEDIISYKHWLDGQDMEIRAAGYDSLKMRELKLQREFTNRVINSDPDLLAAVMVWVYDMSFEGVLAGRPGQPLSLDMVVKVHRQGISSLLGEIGTVTLALTSLTVGVLADLPQPDRAFILGQTEGGATLPRVLIPGMGEQLTRVLNWSPESLTTSRFEILKAAEAHGFQQGRVTELWYGSWLPSAVGRRMDPRPSA